MDHMITSSVPSRRDLRRSESVRPTKQNTRSPLALAAGFDRNSRNALDHRCLDTALHFQPYFVSFRYSLWTFFFLVPVVGSTDETSTFQVDSLHRWGGNKRSVFLGESTFTDSSSEDFDFLSVFITGDTVRPVTIRLGYSSPSRHFQCPHTFW